MERKKDSNEIRDYRKKILNLLNKIENQDNLERIYKYMKHVYIHFPK
jgi:TnpA family transposase